MRSRGSEWSRWDLHVHTPDSLVQKYGRGGVDPWEAFISDLEALPPEFRVIGINDYLFLDGYKRVLDHKAAGRLGNIELFLPVIELRLNHFGGAEGALSRVNLHVLFSDELGADTIQAQFLNGLRCDLSLLPHTDSGDWSSLVTRESLRALGSGVKATLPADQQANAASDLEEGFNNYNVSFESVIELLEMPLFRHKYFLAVGKTEWADVKWTKQSAAFKKTLVNRPHFVFTAATTPSQFAKSRAALAGAGVNDRLLDCSDAHHLSDADEANRIGNSMTWINAVPSFEGLRHAYHEYDTRVHVGDEPPKLATTRAHPTNHVDRIAVDVVDGAEPMPNFRTDLPLNPGFVAIVGNKGKGKSALTDVLGLLGDSKRSADYSFLTPARFRDPKANLAAQHVATLTWLSGTTVTRSLDHDVDRDAAEMVQYLPQSFLESVCNEGPGADDLFSKELGEVIFSHVPEADRLGATSLDELVARRTEATSRRIEILRAELSTTISQVIELERQLDPGTRRALQNRLAEKQAELDAHELAKPAEVTSPSDDDKSRSELEEKIEQLRASIVALDDELRVVQTTANEKSLLLDRAEALRKEVDNFEHQFTTFRERITPLARQLGIEVESVVSLTLHVAVLDDLRLRLDKERLEANRMLSPLEDGSPAKLAAEALAELQEYESELDAPQRAYQNYLTQVAAWKKQKAEIIGSASTPDSLESYRHKLDQLTSAPTRLQELRDRRTAQALEIHGQQLQIASQLRQIYAPVQDFIDQHPVARDRFNLSFEVTVVENGLSERLFAMINRQVSGSFAGTEEGDARLARSIASTDFNDPDAVRTFLDQLDSDLHQDNRPGRSSKSTAVADLLRKSATAQGLFELVFSLDYLSPQFWLRSDEKPISQLSPGQRGTLLLLFYLLIDTSRSPIILDQPEENLDNQTVHELLVPAIAEARRTRQVIAVTHNPNLAVVGDADQVIVAEFSDQEFHYVCGAIEEPEINQRIVAILEGTWPAFRNRSDKYIPTSVLETG
jgi:ABC-type lipoprotein export system ATPase subunit